MEGRYMDRLSVMETFVRIVEMGSFSAAARHMNVGQPTVSKSVAQLEERLGVCLLMRSTRGLRPTEAGQIYFECARRAILEAEEADRCARGANAGLAGRLRVSAEVAFGKLHLMPHLPDFLAAHPELSIDLILEDRAIDLLEEGIDLAICSGPLCDSALVARKIATTERVVVGTPEYFDRAGVPETPDELARHEAVIYTLDRCGSDSWVFSKDGEEAYAKLPDRLRVSASEAVRTAVLRGMGLAVVPRWMFGAELASGDVRPVLTDWDLPESNLWVVFSSGRMANAKSRAFVRFVDSVLGMPAEPEFEGHEAGHAARFDSVHAAFAA
jgi:DNA-binding transcriptional LysR family regulator